MAWIELEVDLKELAHRFAYDLNRSALTAFILEIDEMVADLRFTIGLRDQLNAIITEEEK